MARPVVAAALTIIGGLFIIGGGLVFAFIGAIFAIFGILSGFFLLGLLVGALTLLMGLLMIVAPSGHVVWGALAIVLAIVSLPLALGGFVVGFLLSLIGGVLALRWTQPVDRFIVTEGHRVPPPTQ